MTTIRKIVTSKVDGDSANNNDTGEIRPFGETAFYLDTNGPGNKLVLMMFDGVRTHLKSKVLSPGVLFGSNADSGDGAGLDTIKLIPDATLYDQGSQQYIVVDPTFPNHIHIRAGGTIDNSNTHLFIGGENSNLNIPSGNNPPVYISANNNNWTFGTDGSLTFPGGMTIESQYGGGSRLVIDGKGEFVDIRDSGTILIGYNSTGSVQIGNPEGGTTTEIVSEKARFLLQSVPTSSIGTVGDLQGQVAFDGSYMYYCTQSFGGTTYDVVHSIAQGTSANGADNGYLVANTYQLPQVGWKVYYNGEIRTIDQVNDTGIPGFYVVFVDSALEIPGQATFAWGPTPATNIWKRVAWSSDTW
jgi:hypothetical protein